MRWIAVVASVPLLASLPASSPAQTPLDSAGLGQFYADWSEATIHDGPAGYASYFAPDGMILPPEAPPVTGHEAIAEWLRRTLAESAYITRPDAVVVDDLHILRGWAVQRSSVHGHRIPKAGGDPVPFEAKYLDVLRRNDQGRWEFVYRMWSRNGP